MKKSLLETKGYFENGQYNITHVKITKKVACHADNTSFKLSTGFQERTFSCEEACEKKPSVDGFYMCVSGNCIFFPNP